MNYPCKVFITPHGCVGRKHRYVCTYVTSCSSINPPLLGVSHHITLVFCLFLALQSLARCPNLPQLKHLPTNFFRPWLNPSRDLLGIFLFLLGFNPSTTLALESSRFFPTSFLDSLLSSSILNRTIKSSSDSSFHLCLRSFLKSLQDGGSFSMNAAT